MGSNETFKENKDAPTYGSSIPVPNVQELLVNHGAAKEVLQNMKDAASQFFDLPLEEKNKYAMPSNDIQGGADLDWSDALILVVYPSHYRKLKFWPESPKGFKEIIEEYPKEIGKVEVELLQSLSVIMGMDKDTCTAQTIGASIPCELLPCLLQTRPSTRLSTNIMGGYTMGQLPQ
ncbi:hypothetical protein CRYUN_Cryun05aG0257700 [Craigia yunnanensis]